MAVPKKTRFEVFKRDGFRCGYCGKTPPAVTLEVDHIEPVANGGEDDLYNLITACFDCNRGKRDIPLTKIPPKISENLEVLREQEDQIKEYRKFIDERNKRIKREISKINKVFSAHFKGYSFSDTFKEISIKRFLEQLTADDLISSLNLGISRFPEDRDRAIKYFCGVCWNKIKSLTDPKHEKIRQLKYFWFKQPKGSGYVKEEILRGWLDHYSDEEIRDAMVKALGRWNDLKDLLGE